MSDYRIDVRGATVIEGLRTGHPVAAQHVVVSVSLVRYGQNSNELKPELLWGPTIMYPSATHAEMIALMAPVFEKVVAAHQAGEPTQVDFISP